MFKDMCFGIFFFFDNVIKMLMITYMVKSIVPIIVFPKIMEGSYCPLPFVGIPHKAYPKIKVRFIKK